MRTREGHDAERERQGNPPARTTIEAGGGLTSNKNRPAGRHRFEEDFLEKVRTRRPLRKHSKRGQREWATISDRESLTRSA